VDVALTVTEPTVVVLSWPICAPLPMRAVVAAAVSTVAWEIERPIAAMNEADPPLASELRVRVAVAVRLSDVAFLTASGWAPVAVVSPREASAFEVSVV